MLRCRYEHAGSVKRSTADPPPLQIPECLTEHTMTESEKMSEMPESV